MELSESRPFETAHGRKATPTHDFLSLYTHSSAVQEPRPSHGGFLKTHNFLEPPEAEEKNVPKEDNPVDMNLEKPPLSAPPPSAVQHVLPGGFGTYSISQISYSNLRLPKPEENVFTVAPVPGNDRSDENSNCSSYTGGGFTLWDESAARKRNSGKENGGDVNVVKEPTLKEGHWPLDQPTQSSSNHRSSVSPLSPSQAPVQKSQSFMEMINSAKGPHPVEENEENLSLKRESSSWQKGELRVRVEGKNCDQKPNTPRSKHSATEQRRRCKINDRLQKLRGLIPHGDQKRDKASFLLEVIEYIQFLQEKVNRHEGSHPGWSSEPTNLSPWRNHVGSNESFGDEPRVVDSVSSSMLMFGAKLDGKAASVSSNILRNTQFPAEPNACNTIDFKTVYQQSGMTYKTVSSTSPLQSDACASIRNNCAANQPSSRIPFGMDDASFSHLQLWKNTISASEPAASSNKLKDQQLAFDGGTVSISSIYSQGLLNTLTRALQTSALDLSQASISVQIDIGKRANNKQYGQDPVVKKVAEAPGGASVESDRTVKRLKTI